MNWQKILTDSCSLGDTANVKCLLEPLTPDESLAELGLMRLERFRLFMPIAQKANIGYSTVIAKGSDSYRVRALQVFDGFPRAANHIEAVIDDLPKYQQAGFGIYAPSTTGNTFGEDVRTWAEEPTSTVAGILRELSGDKRYAANLHGYDADFRLILTPPVDIAVGYNVEYTGRRFEVKFVNDVLEAGQVVVADLLWLSSI